MDIMQPPALKRGDTIGIVAPASPFDKSLFEKGIRQIAAHGFVPVYTDDLFQTSGYLAGSDAHRAGLLNAYFKDPGIKGIWCVRGGYGALRILTMLDYQMIADNPKPFVGCSDITAVLNALYNRCGLVTVHGPMVASLDRSDDATIEAIFNGLTSFQPITLSVDGGQVIHSGNACGPVTGGNLSTLCHLLGTPFAPDFNGSILFLEDTGEKPYRIDRMLFQMKLAGCFKSIVGVCLGSFENCGEISLIHQIVQDVFSDIPIPILGGFLIGHGLPNLALPIGQQAAMDTETRSLTYLAPAVKPC